MKKNTCAEKCLKRVSERRQQVKSAPAKAWSVGFYHFECLRHLLENLKGNFVMKDDIDGEDASFGYKRT